MRFENWEVVITYGADSSLGSIITAVLDEFLLRNRDKSFRLDSKEQCLRILRDFLTSCPLRVTHSDATLRSAVVNADWSALMRNHSTAHVTVTRVDNEAKTKSLYTAMAIICAVELGKNRYDRLRHAFVSMASDMGVRLGIHTPPVVDSLQNLGYDLLSIPAIRSVISDPTLIEDVNAFTPEQPDVSGRDGVSNQELQCQAGAGFTRSVEVAEAFYVLYDPTTHTDLQETLDEHDCLFAHHFEKISGESRLYISHDDPSKLPEIQRLCRNMGIIPRGTNKSHRMVISALSYDPVAQIKFMLKFPDRVQRDIKSSKFVQSVTINPESRQEAYGLEMLLWFDGYRADCTAVKYRIIDREGAALPQKITPPMTLLTFQGTEKLIPSFFDDVQRLMNKLIGIPFACGDSSLLPRSRVVISLLGICGDHKALQIVSGVKRGRYYRSPFSSLHMGKVASDPFANRCDRWTIADSIRLRDAGGVKDMTRFGSRDGHRDVCCLTYANEIDGPLHVLTKYADVTFIPPVMHVSHYLMKDFWTLLGLVKVQHAGQNVHTLEQIEKLFTRTTGCNEQSWNRRKLATLVNEHLEEFDQSLQPFILLTAKLQALYYSSDHVTHQTIAFHHAASFSTFIMFHVLTLFYDLPSSRSSVATTLNDGLRLTYSPKFTGSLYLNAVVSVLPKVHSKLRLPMFYLLEEYFERDFLINAQLRVDKHRSWVLGFLAQKTMVGRVLAHYTRRGSSRKHGMVLPIARQCKSVTFCSCLFDADRCAAWRNRLLTKVPNWDREASQQSLNALFSGWVKGICEEPEEIRELITVDETAKTICVRTADSGLDETLCICNLCNSEQRAEELMRRTGHNLRPRR
ncbi:hypothetical protein J8273_6817 [Carpediemonas membranifera]|uniref:Uncharacterized protein n=1 Tax=Carpediemonas membranifera TaxID=201153 RepID=A0A8J6B310_9EUKA|nr:hypothetical protein J8273_6817 [Carpediemonas membranifera]|eukprot:KAG9391892.1 hypothetical protein J8273_6817 [Carpediemonas membranifera]